MLGLCLGIVASLRTDAAGAGLVVVLLEKHSGGARRFDGKCLVLWSYLWTFGSDG